MQATTLEKENKTSLQTNQLQLINGSFSKKEAITIINSLTDIKINFHKLQRLSITEGDNTDPCAFDSSRIDELMNDKKEANNFLNGVISKGSNIKITSTIHISVDE